MMISVRKLALLFFLVIFSCNSSSKNNIDNIVSISGKTMGTTYNIKFLPKSSNPEEIEKNYLQIEAILKDINLQMSTYIADSEISTFNRLEKTEWFKISQDFETVVRKSFQYNKLSDGLYDITIMPLVNLWGFGPAAFDSKPSKAEIDSVMTFIGQDLIEIDDLKIRKKDSRVQIDLSSIAKGFAVDKLFNFLKDYDELFIEIGGEIRTKSINKDWKVGINTPDINNIDNDIELIISLNNLSIATSGNYRNYYFDQDNFFHHELNPNTGYPVISNTGSVSVISRESCMDADALSTMLYVIDSSLTYDIVDKINVAESLIIKIAEDGSFKKEFSKNFPKN